MGKNKKGLIAALVVLLLFSGLYVLLRSLNLEEEQTEEGTGEKTVFETKADDMAQLKVEYNGNTYTFVHGDDTWSYQEDSQFPLSESAVLNLVSGVTSISSSRELDNPGDFSEYGLDNPEVKVTVKDQDGKEVLLNFGNDNEAVGGCYMNKDDEKEVYLVDSTIKQQFCVNIQDLAEKEEIPTISSTTIQKVTIKQSGSQKSLEKDETSETGWSYKASSNDTDDISVAADSSKVSSFMSNYSGITWLDFISYDKSDLSKYGLDTSTEIIIDYQVTETSDEEEKTVDKQAIFYIGSQDEDGNYYAMLKDGQYVYTLSSSTVENMVTLKEDDFISSLVANYSFADMDKVTFVRNNQTYVAEKREVEKEETEEDSEETETEQKYYLNDKEIDKTLFTDFYAKVSGMEWQSRDAQATTENSPEMTITFEKEGGIHVTVDYYSYDANFYLVVDSKGNKVLVNKMKVKEMLDSFDSMIEEWNQ